MTQLTQPEYTISNKDLSRYISLDAAVRVYTIGLKHALLAIKDAAERGEVLKPDCYAIDRAFACLDEINNAAQK